MPRELAALIFCAFIAYLFWRELREPDAEKISWIPFAWMFVAGSRFVSRWVGLTPPVGAGGYLEGSPVDRAFFLCLIILGLIVPSYFWLFLMSFTGPLRGVLIRLGVVGRETASATDGS